MAHEYTDEFFQSLREGARRSAEVVVPILLQLMQPQSVVDVGCGTGTWLAVFGRHGITDYFGLDGYVRDSQLEIPRDQFLKVDLSRQLVLGRSFDLAISLEVAEHLPGSVARTFVESLTRLARRVVFSAAVPGQSGTGHLNEQWPRYWADLFAAHGFHAVDVVRPRIWDDERVEPWYAQNTILYVAQTHSDSALSERHSPDIISAGPLAMVHPRLFTARDRALTEARQELQSLREALATAAQRHRAAVEALNAQLGRLRSRSDPRNMSLRAYVRAIPHVVSGALRRARSRM